MHMYEIIYYWRNEDQAFIAEVSELPGCTAQGYSRESTFRNVNDAMQFWFDQASALVRSVPEPKGECLMLT